MPVLWYEGSSVSAATRRFLHADYQGSIVAISNASAGLTQRNTYDVYGVAGAGNAGRFAYTGQIELPELGLYHYKARVYSPAIGRFLQTDPIGYQDQINLYAYVGNDPINAVDPNGEESASIAVGCLGPCGDIDPAAASALGEAVVGLTPLGDLQSIKEAFDNPTRVNIAMALVGAIPEVGGAAKTGLKAVEKGAAAAERAKNIAKGIPESRLGPSGKPMQHTVEHSSRKEAQQAAKREADKAGGTVRNDAHPTNSNQGPHFQAEDAKGENVKQVVHHEYPDK